MAKQEKKCTVKKTTKERKPYVKYSTVWNSVGGGLNNPGESKLVKVGKHKILLSRAEKLDRYGNPVHTATLINKDGTVGASYRSNGHATFTTAAALNKNGIEVKKTKKTVKRSKK